MLPELSVTGYTASDLLLSRPLLQGALEALEKMRAYSAHMDLLTCVGAPLAFEGRLYNCAVYLKGGEILAISQFTLHGDVRHGRRPSFIRAARPEVAVPMYDAYCQGLREAGIHVETGIFQTDMKVSLVNDGPVTLLIDSRRTF